MIFLERGSAPSLVRKCGPQMSVMHPALGLRVWFSISSGDNPQLPALMPHKRWMFITTFPLSFSRNVCGEPSLLTCVYCFLFVSSPLILEAQGDKWVTPCSLVNRQTGSRWVSFLPTCYVFRFSHVGRAHTQTSIFNLKHPCLLTALSLDFLEMAQSLIHNATWSGFRKLSWKHR